MFCFLPRAGPRQIFYPFGFVGQGDREERLGKKRLLIFPPPLASSTRMGCGLDHDRAHGSPCSLARGEMVGGGNSCFSSCSFWGWSPAYLVVRWRLEWRLRGHRTWLCTVAAAFVLSITAPPLGLEEPDTPGISLAIAHSSWCLWSPLLSPQAALTPPAFVPRRNPQEF